MIFASTKKRLIFIILHDIQFNIVIFTLLKSYLEKANAGVAAVVAAECSRDWNGKGSRNNKE